MNVIKSAHDRKRACAERDSKTFIYFRAFGKVRDVQRPFGVGPLCCWHGIFTLLTYLLAYFTYVLTPWSRVLLEKLTGFQLVKKFPTFYGTRKFITAFTSARHLSLTWASSIQSMFLFLGTVNCSKHIFDNISTEMYFFVNKFSLKMTVTDLNM